METRPKHIIGLIKSVNERFGRLVGLEVEARKNKKMNRQLIAASKEALKYFAKLKSDSQQRVRSLRASGNDGGIWQEHRFQVVILKSVYDVTEHILKEANHAEGN